jgi:hypothetical protein
MRARVSFQRLRGCVIVAGAAPYPGIRLVELPAFCLQDGTRFVANVRRGMGFYGPTVTR